MRDYIEWTEERKASLARLWNSGHSATDLAAFFGTTVFAVTKHVEEMRSRGLRLQRHQNFGTGEHWSDEDREEVFRRKALGATCESIAYYVGRSPFAVRRLLLERSV